MMPTSDRLQALLDRAHEANKVEPNRVSLETFLAGLQQEDQDLAEAQLKQIQLTIYETLLSLFDTTTSVSKTTQACAATASCAMQTDAATISLWGLLPNARTEAYERGLDAGKNAGYAQGNMDGNNAGMKEGVAIGFEKGRAEGMKTGLEQSKEVETQRGIEIGRTLGYADGLAEGIKQAKQEIMRLGGEDTCRHMSQEKTTQEKIVVKLPPKPVATIPKEKDEEKPKPKINGIDPFASLLSLARKK